MVKEINFNKIKKDFPIFKEHPNLVYLDNGASSQTPLRVVAVLDEYYLKLRSNVHRGLYQLSQEATARYENSRKTVADFIGAETNEVIFTGGATLSINMLIYSLEQSTNLKKGDRIITSIMEHHSNLLPLQELAKRQNLDLQYIEINNKFELDYNQARKLINNKTKIISLTLASNVLGTINDIKKISKLAHGLGAIVIVDASKAVGHIPLNVKDLDCDFLFFSGHKMCGPTGIGILYGKEEQLKKLNPSFFGGGIVQGVTRKKAQWREIPSRFEAGTPNIAGALGLAEACHYLDEIGLENIHIHIEKLMNYTIEEMEKIDNLKLIGQKKTKENIGVLSFLIKNIHPHDLAEIVARDDVAIRAGHHCAQPLMEFLGVSATNRISFYIYNNKKDIDKFIEALKKAQQIFSTTSL